MGPFGGNGEEGKRGTHMIPHTDNEEAREVGRRRDIGDSRGGSSVRSSRNTVRDDLNREMKGNHCIVGVVSINL